MIYSLKGKLISVVKNHLVLEINGLSFEIFITKKVFENLPEKDEDIFIYIYLDVKENSLTLYGFYDLKEKEIFKLLLTVNGISCKTANTILSYATFEDIVELINDKSNFKLLKIPGIGEKKLDLISVTLKDKIYKIVTQSVSYDTENSSSVIRNSPDDSRLDALNALINLGYPRNEAEKIIREVIKRYPDSELTVESIIKKSFEILS